MKNSILILLLFFTACSKNDTNILKLPNETFIECIEYPNELITTYPISIDIIKNKLFLFLYKGENLITVIDANNGKVIKKTGEFGNGPGEFLQPAYWGINDEKDIYLYDLRQKKLRIYSYEDIINAPSLPKTDGISLKNTDAEILSGKILKNNNFICSVVFGIKNPIIKLDKELNITEGMGDIPDKDHLSTSLNSYGGSISTDNNKFVFTMASLGYIAFYEESNEKAHKKVWDHYIEAPIYNGNQLNRKELKLGFSDVKMTKNYIFCSYFGEKLSRKNLKTLKARNILVFDHEGNILKNLRANRSVAKITVSEDEKTLYAVTDEPEIAIIRFDITNLLN